MIYIIYIGQSKKKHIFKIFWLLPSSVNTFFKQYSFTFTNFYNTEFFFLNKTILLVILTIKMIIPKQKKFLEINYKQLNKVQNKLLNEKRKKRLQ